MGWVEEWLNRDDIKAELGVPLDRNFESCNMQVSRDEFEGMDESSKLIRTLSSLSQVNQNFMFQGDGMHNSAALIPDLLASGIRVLI